MAIIELPYAGITGLPRALDQFAKLTQRMVLDCDGKPLADCDGNIIIKNQCPPRDSLFGGDCLLPHSAVWISGYSDGDIPASGCGSCSAYSAHPTYTDIPWPGFWVITGLDNPCIQGATSMWYVSPASTVFSFQSTGGIVYAEIDGKTLQDFTGGGSINGIWLDCANQRWKLSIRCNNVEMWTGYQSFGLGCYERGLGTYTRAAGCAASPSSLTLVTHPTIAISPGSLPAGAVGVPYSETLTQSGGGAGGDWYVAANLLDLPPGLSINPATGEISGTPTTAMTRSVNFVYVATDAPYVDDLSVLIAGVFTDISANATRAFKTYSITINP